MPVPNYLAHADHIVLPSKNARYFQLLQQLHCGRLMSWRVMVWLKEILVLAVGANKAFGFTANYEICKS